TPCWSRSCASPAARSFRSKSRARLRRMPKKPSVTELIHHPYQPPAGFEAVPVGVHKASTVIFANTAAMRARDWRHKDGYTYGLHGTPTTFTLEERIATLEGGKHTLLTPSGLAAFAAFEVGVDISMHALTKYPSGGGDVLMGAVTTRDDALHQRLKLAHMHLGLGVGANDAETLLRSLPSLPLRYAAHDRAARQLA